MPNRPSSKQQLQVLLLSNHQWVFSKANLVNRELFIDIRSSIETMAIALQALDVDVQLMILEVVCREDCLYLVTL